MKDPGNRLIVFSIIGVSLFYIVLKKMYGERINYKDNSK